MKPDADIPNSPDVSQRTVPAAGGGITIRQRRVNRWRLAWFLAALMLVVTDTAWFCWLQPATPPELNPKFSWSKWLWLPHEKNPALRLPMVPDSDLRGAFFTNNLGWVVGSGGVILHTKDSGKTWELQTNISWPKPVPVYPMPKSPPKSKASLKKQYASAQDFNSKPDSQNTADTATFQPASYRLDDATAPKLVFVQEALPAKMAPALNAAQSPLSSEDIRILDVPPSADPKNLSTVCFADDKTGWAFGEGGTVLETTNGGESWDDQTSSEKWMEFFPDKISPQFSYAEKVAGYEYLEGLIQSKGVSPALANAYATYPWPNLGMPTILHLRGFFAINTPSIWLAVGAPGLIMHTSDGGKTWAWLTLNPISGANGDESKKWVATHAYTRWPAAMFYFGLLLAMVCLWIGLLKKNETVEFKPSIADFAVSDRPLTSKDFDALNFGPLAQGIANFLRNKSTTGPLTLAVAGPWGSGKSSIMGLLREKLERQGIRPVWFNAWHHQDEKQLLAALLENIRSQAVPPWYSWRGASFRVKLINRRMHREWPMLFLGTLFIASFAAVLNFVIKDGLSWDAVKEMVSKPDLFSAGKLAVLATALVTGWKILQGFQAFGLNPAKLLASVTEKAKLSDLGEQTSFRHRFAQEFEDVTAALQPRTMTVFIDDLDRCEPEQVMSVMQSLNFLSSSGECFLVIGMEENAVTNCVAISLKEQFDSQQGQKLDEAVSVQRRWDYARLWMEKLIQIRIPVPDPSDDQFRALLTGKTSAQKIETLPGNLVVEWLARCRVASVPALPWAGLLAVILAGFFLTSFELDRWPWLKQQLAPKPEAPAAAMTWPTNSLIQPGGLQAVQLSVPGGVSGVNLMTNANFEEWFAQQKWNVNLEFAPNLVSNNVSVSSQNENIFPPLPGLPPLSQTGSGTNEIVMRVVPGQKSFGGWWLALPFLIAVLVYGWKKIAEILEQRYGDSEDFRGALRRWSGVIQADAGTPRAAKRLINKLRFYAMMSRALKAANVADIPENVVVAFGVNEHRIRSGTVTADEKLDKLLRIERNLNPDGAVKSIGTDLNELEAVWKRQPEIFRYLSSTVKTENGGGQKAA